MHTLARAGSPGQPIPTTVTLVKARTHMVLVTLQDVLMPAVENLLKKNRWKIVSREQEGTELVLTIAYRDEGTCEYTGERDYPGKGRQLGERRSTPSPR